MGKIVVFNNLTLDGVAQAPAGPDEDTRGGFKHGGWAAPFRAMEEVGDALGEVGAVLLGRWTYESFHRAWANRPDNRFSTFFNEIPKYVVSSSLEEPLVWKNSILIGDEIPKTIAEIKQTIDKNIVVFGSETLIQTLMQHDLVDKYVLLIHPVVLGTGRRMFVDGGAPATIVLRECKTTLSGVVILIYDNASGVR